MPINVKQDLNLIKINILANTYTYALEALTTIIVIHPCISIDTTLLSIGRFSDNTITTVLIREASSEFLSCNQQRDIPYNATHD